MPPPGAVADSLRLGGGRQGDSRQGDSPGTGASASGGGTLKRGRVSPPRCQGAASCQGPADLLEPFQGLTDLPEPCQGLMDPPEPCQGQAPAAWPALPAPLRAETWQECAAMLLPNMPLLPPMLLPCPDALAWLGEAAPAAGDSPHSAGVSGVIADLARAAAAAHRLAPAPGILERAMGGSGALMAAPPHAGHGVLLPAAGGSNASADLATIFDYCDGLSDLDFLPLEALVGFWRGPEQRFDGAARQPALTEVVPPECVLHV